MSDSNAHLFFYLGGVGVGLATVVAGFFKYWTPHAQITNAKSFLSVKELENEVKEKLREHNEVPPFYAFISGRIFIEERSCLTAPRTRRSVVAYESREGRKTERKTETVFFVQDEGKTNLKVEVRPYGAIFFLYPILNQIFVKESILESKQRVFITGEVSYESHTKKIVIQKPKSGMRFVISGIPLDDVLFQYNVRYYVSLFAGSAVSITSLILLVFKLVKKAK